MKKKLLVLLMLILAIACVCASVCFAEEVVEESLENAETTQSWFKIMWAKYGDKITNALSGVSLGTILSAVAVALVKKETTKVANKVDDDNTIAKLKDGVINGIQNAKIDLSIQPIVKHEIAKISEIAYGECRNNQEELKSLLFGIVEIQELQAKYFDNSVAVNDESKKALKDKIEQVKSAFDIVEKSAPITIETKAEEVKVEKEVKMENY